jgi:drug/metabolite transporter (DMT)-like permease
MLVSVAPAIFLLLWSGGFTVAKIGIHDADPITLLSLRYFCVVALLLPFVLYIRPALPANRGCQKALLRRYSLLRLTQRELPLNLLGLLGLGVSNPEYIRYHW